VEDTPPPPPPLQRLCKRVELAVDQENILEQEFLARQYPRPQKAQIDDLQSVYVRGVKHTARGPNPARCVVGSSPRDDFVK